MPDELKDLKTEDLDKRITDIPDSDAISSPGPADSTGTPASTGADPNVQKGTRGAAPIGEPAGKKDDATTTGTEGDQALLLAGKYKTPDDLTKGVEEITKRLNLHEVLLTEEIEAAKASGDWKGVEEVYKKLDAELTRKAEADKAKLTPAAVKPTGDVTTLSAEEIQRIKNETKERFNMELSEHPVIRDLADAGVEFPITKDTLTDLKQANYGLYMALKSAISEVQTKLEKEATGYAEALAGVYAATDEAKTEGTAYLTKINSEMGLGYTEDEMKAVVDAALQDKAVSEQKFGIDYPIKEAVRRYFWLNRHEEVMNRATESARAKGRTEHTEDLRKMRDKTTDTVSQAALPGSKNRSGVTGKIDFTNPENVRGAGDDALDQRLKELASE